MYCPKCGCEIDYKTKYCRKCGAKLPYNMEFDKNSDPKSNKFNLSTRNQIMILSILGLVVIIILSSFAFSGIFFNSPSNVQGSSSSFDDFINNNVPSGMNVNENKIADSYEKTKLIRFVRKNQRTWHRMLLFPFFRRN